MKYRFIIAMSLVFLGASLQKAWAVTDGQDASDLLGQLNSADDTARYTKGDTDNVVNNRGLTTPYDVALDTTTHRLFVLDSDNSRVLVYNLDSSDNLLDRVADNVLGQPDLDSNATAATQTGLNTPFALDFDPSRQRLYVADSGNNRVLVYDVTSITDGENAINVLGQTNFTNSGTATTQARFNSPRGVYSISNSTYLYVSDTGNNRVLTFDVGTITDGENAGFVLGQTNFTNSGAATTQARLSSPRGLVYSKTGNHLFVADSGNNRVMIFDVASITNGENAVNVLGQANFTTGTAATSQTRMRSPQGVAYDTDFDRLFVGDNTNHRVTVYDVAVSTNGENAINVLGQTLYTTNATGATQTGMNLPIGVDYDLANKRLYVADSGNNRVLTHAASTSTITNGQNASDGVGQLTSADAMIFTKVVANNIPNNRGLNATVGVEIDTATHRMFVADTSNNRVLVYDLASNNVITDRVADYVLGQPDFETNSAAATQTKLSQPRGVTYDATTSRLFVSDASNNRVMIFDVASITNGENAINVLGQTNFTNNGTAATQTGMSGPRQTCYDSTNKRFFVADQGNNRVTVYNLSSITNGQNAANVLGQTNFTNNGTAATQTGMNGPAGCSYDSVNSRLAVPDFSNNRVLVYDVAAITNGENAINVLGQTNFTNNGTATTQAGMNQPAGITFDESSTRLFVGDYANNRVTVYDVTSITNGENAVNVLGQANFTSAGAATTQAGMSGPVRLTYDKSFLRLYVAEQTNNRISVFSTEALLGIAVSPSSYAFGTVNLNSTTVSTTAIVVTNTGNVSETYSISVATTGAQTLWSVGTSTPTSFNTFALFGTVNNTQPLPASFGSTDIVTQTPGVCSSTKYSVGGASCTGVAAGAAQNFWMRLDMPLSTSTTTQQQMTVTMTAATP